MTSFMQVFSALPGGLHMCGSMKLCTPDQRSSVAVSGGVVVQDAPRRPPRSGIGLPHASSSPQLFCDVQEEPPQQRSRASDLGATARGRCSGAAPPIAVPRPFSAPDLAVHAPPELEDVGQEKRSPNPFGRPSGASTTTTGVARSRLSLASAPSTLLMDTTSTATPGTPTPTAARATVSSSLIEAALSRRLSESQSPPLSLAVEASHAAAAAAALAGEAGEASPQQGEAPAAAAAGAGAAGDDGPPPCQACPEERSRKGVSLAVRRKLNTTFVKTPAMIDKEKASAEEAKRPKRTVRRIERIDDEYVLSGEVFPCSREGMRVETGTRRATGEEVVVKLRTKASFEDAHEEGEWRDTANLALNLPSTQLIAHVLEVLETDDTLYVIMEKVGGLDLFETLSAEGLMDIDEVKGIVRQLLLALADLHAKGYLHKDVKLENVMYIRSPSSSPKVQEGKASSLGDPGSVDGNSVPVSPASPGGCIKLIDFDTMCVDEASHCCGKAILGTDQYLAPEAYRGQYSQATDVFAVGVVTYLLLTGYFPFSESIFRSGRGENFVGSPSMEQVRAELLSYRVDWTRGILKQDLEARSFVASMLAMNRWNRPSAKEALSHPWLGEPLLDAARRERRFSTCPAAPTMHTGTPCRQASELVGLVTPTLAT
eukprot:TRINITY_DN28555_c0_g1_i1.p1 TRINITY_DN28555_c0_g1~~TRINITY_DN28555_c0_g1_i1.p1  ORF type:complete len:656 (-),score=169.38 TRINITY_DN28555_c0_g1_i1:53-2020(-)